MTLNPSTLAPYTVLVLGLGATLAFDLWGLLLVRILRVKPANICFVGRWLAHMPAGTFRHVDIASAPSRRFECLIGWVAHYLIGGVFAVAFTILVGADWLSHPTLLPALSFGVVTVLAPFLLMQPAMGLGVAASRAPDPTQARLRSVSNHAAFGIGLYLTAVLVQAALGPWP